MIEFQKFLFPVELIAIIILALVLLRIRSTLPDLFFPATNVNVYLPPEAEEVGSKKLAKP